MKKNCSFDFRRLFPTSTSMVEQLTTVGQQQITVFCNGGVFVCDLTEIRARAIIAYATQEMEEKIGREGTNLSRLQGSFSPPAGLSMKRSLQRFLQKRKQRTRASSPYAHH